MPATIYPVIMCGGAGSRLWPKSRKAQPKQFLSLVEDDTMLQATLRRMTAAPDEVTIAEPTIICGAGQEDLAEAQLKSIFTGGGDVLIEPFGRNTAAVAAVASAHVLAKDADGLVLLLPADHFVRDPAGFWSGVMSGMPAAETGELVTLGIQPTGPETGYGYIERGHKLGENVYKVAKFKEKPDRETAEEYLATNNFFWNAGIFLFQANAMRSAFEAHASDILTSSEAALSASDIDGARRYLDANAFTPCPSEPVDIAIMEKSDRVAVVAPVKAGWSDVGSWAVISELRSEVSNDPTGAIRGDVMAIDCSGSLIETDGPTVAAIGLKDMIVIVENNSVLIVPKDRAQDVKTIVNTLKSADRSEKL